MLLPFITDPEVREKLLRVIEPKDRELLEWLQPHEIRAMWEEKLREKGAITLEDRIKALEKGYVLTPEPMPHRVKRLEKYQYELWLVTGMHYKYDWIWDEIEERKRKVEEEKVRRIGRSLVNISMNDCNVIGQPDGTIKTIPKAKTVETSKLEEVSDEEYEEMTDVEKSRVKLIDGKRFKPK